jgi:acetyl/propionyl-CoA carboxylase alpha subunit
MIRRLLVANRGEIAVRIIRAARRLGIRTVAVYSEADRTAYHTHLADEAVALGAAPATESYLDAAKVIRVALDTKCDALHPGYGFLSERAEFAQTCEDAGITFVGPPSGAMRMLGSKMDAKALAVAAGVPVTPGYFEPGADRARLEAEARKLGYPVMLKASAGGGGRGMRIVTDPASFREQFDLATDEALKGFGDGSMMVEKLIAAPRHVEVQVLADSHGNVACLYERECSVQRRHQKLLEESPSPLFLPDSSQTSLWQEMRASAEELVRRSGYRNAGTVEFMVDEQAGQYYFLEVNARLQVEHPVTESITGLDLVEWQLRVAAGEALDLPAWIMQGDRRAIRGHAIEARIIAEDPSRGFAPSTGVILAWAPPTDPSVRVDSGFRAGDEISHHYDSLLAKVIAHGQTRLAALGRLRDALEDFHILGVRTNIPFLLEVLSHPRFVEGRLDTNFLQEEFPEWVPSADWPPELANLCRAAGSVVTARAREEVEGPWADQTDWRIYGA